MTSVGVSMMLTVSARTFSSACPVSIMKLMCLTPYHLKPRLPKISSPGPSLRTIFVTLPVLHTLVPQMFMTAMKTLLKKRAPLWSVLMTVTRMMMQTKTPTRSDLLWDVASLFSLFGVSMPKGEK